MSFLNKISFSFIAPMVAFSLSGCGSSSSSTEPPPPPPPVSDSVNYQEMIDDLVSDEIPGVVLLVETPEERFLGSAGLADIDTVESMQTYHQMPTASAGKPMIALLATILHTEGFLNLDDTLASWLPAEMVALIPNGDQITLRQMLNHTSGIFNHLEETDFFEAVVNDPSILRTDIDIIPFGLNKPAYFSPGEGYEYSNTGYVLAGIILDEVLTTHHSTELRNRIFTPLGMTNTYYKGIEKDLGDFVSGYDDLGNGVLENVKTFQENMARANAPVVSTVEDLALFLKSLIADESFVSQQVRDTMFSESNLIDVNGEYYYGLGIHKLSRENKTLYFHNGGEPGYFTTNIYISETQTSITAFINCSVLPSCEVALDNLTQTVLQNEL